MPLKMQKNIQYALKCLCVISWALILGACEEVEEVQRELSPNEAHVMSKQWCAQASVAYGPPLNGVVPSLIKLDLTQVGYVTVSIVTRSAFVNPPKFQQNILSCNMTETENIIDCYGVGPVAFSLSDFGKTLKIELIEEAESFAECTTAEMNQFRAI